MMKKEWSGSWNSSVQPRKQRKFRYNAPLHVRQRFVSVNLSPELRKRFGTRSMQVRKGDEIRVVRGDMKKKTGVVDRVDVNKSRIYVEELKVKKVDGSEVHRPMQPSNLMITKLKLDDKKRQAILERAGSAAKPKPEPKAETKPSKRKDKKAEVKKPAVKKAPKKAPAKKPAPKKTTAKKSPKKPANKKERK
jgi:large subunit ribosomal protein L24